MKKVLILENINELDEILNSYLNKHNINDYDVIYNAENESDKIIQKMRSDEYGTLLIQSTFYNERQFDTFIDLLSLIETSIKDIKILYTKNDFEIFLSKHVNNNPELSIKVKTIFEKFNVYSIEHITVAIKQTYIDKLVYYFDTVKMFHNLKLDMYFLERTPILDKFEHERKYKTRVVIPETDPFTKKELREVLDELESMLEFRSDGKFIDKKADDRMNTTIGKIRQKYKI